MSYYLLITLFIIVFGLLVPYFILKTGFKAAHVVDPKEKSTIELKDIPKDQKKIAKEK